MVHPDKEVRERMLHYKAGSCPEAEKDEVINIPNHIALSDDVETVERALRRVLMAK